MDNESRYYLAIRPREAVRDGKDWLLDCFSEVEERQEIASLNAVGVVAAVERYYLGGWESFLRDGDNLKADEENLGPERPKARHDWTDHDARAAGYGSVAEMEEIRRDMLGL